MSGYLKVILAACAAIGFGMAVSPANADMVRGESGVTCSMDTDTSPVKLTLEVTHGDEDSDSWNSRYYSDSRDEFEITAGIEIAVGAPKGLDCNKLYQQELRIQELKLKQLEEQLKQYQTAADVVWEE